MMIVREYNNFKPARLALLIAFALAGSMQNAMARDYFNPDLVELDNPQNGVKPISLRLKRARRRREPITSM